MSRRASLLAKEQKTRPKVRFPDELVFLDNIKEGDVPAMQNMLRRVSVSIDVNSLGSSGMTPLHQTVMEDNAQAVRLLVRHGCDLNKKDIDSWTPLHAACANGFSDVVKVLLEGGADPSILTDDGERPYDLIEPNDLDTVGVMLSYRTMHEGVEEEGSDLDESGSDASDTEDNKPEENHQEEEGSEEESVHEEQSEEEESENEEDLYEQDSLEADEDNDSICEGAHRLDTDLNNGENGKNNNINGESESETVDGEQDQVETLQLGGNRANTSPKVIKSILKHSSDKPRKTMKFAET